MNGTLEGFEHAALQRPTIRDVTITIERLRPPLSLGSGFYYLLGMPRISKAVWCSSGLRLFCVHD